MMDKIMYDTDYYLWTELQAKALESRNFSLLDLENLIEEVRSLGRSEYQAVCSLLQKQLEHFLKLRYVPLPENRNKWKSEIYAFKGNIQRKFTPSMKPKLINDLLDIYTIAVKIVAVEYEIAIPETDCSYLLDDLLSMSAHDELI